MPPPIAPPILESPSVVQPILSPIDWTVTDQVLTGQQLVRRDADKVDCGVFCSTGVPQWLWIVESLGFQPLWCLLSVVADLEWLRKVYPKIVFTTELQYCRPVAAVFCDGRPLKACLRWPELQLLFSLRSAAGIRGLSTNWENFYVDFSHVSVGGCSDASLKVNCMARIGTSYERSSCPTTVIPGCVYTVASDTLDLGQAAPAPVLRRLPTCEILKLGKSLYHGGGLYPSGSHTHPVFLLPSVLTSSGWCRRRLTLEETWGVFDVPHRIVALLCDRPSSQAWNDCRLLLPGRCLEYGVRELLIGMKGRVEGGRILFSRSTRKRHRVEMEKSLEERGSKAVLPPILEASGEASGESMEAPWNERIQVDLKAQQPSKRLSTLPHEAGEKISHLKATKADDARVRVEEWDAGLAQVMGLKECQELTKAAEAIRTFCLRWWRRRLTRSFFCWLHQKPEYQGVGLDDMAYVVEKVQAHTPGEPEKIYRWALLGRAVYCDWWSARDARHFKDLKAAREVAERSSKATWFEWTDGSVPVHWKWPEWYQAISRDGLPIWFLEAPKQWRRPQPPGINAQIHQMMKAKLSKVRERRYVQGSSDIRSLISFFAVPKGEEDVRMVYDGTKSGLNDCIWVPRFPLPTVGTHLRAVEAGTYMGDMDVGEMFLNFILHESMQALCGIDLTSFFGIGASGKQTGKPKLLWERWVRAAMGLKSSPYQAVQGMLVVKEVILGDRRDAKNVFRWDEVRMNLPGSETYDPTLPWVSKIRLEDGRIAADLFIYVDDVRLTGSSAEECRQAGRRAASVANSLGIQDAARKRRFGSQRPGAWAGSVVETSQEGVFVTVSQEKWDKCKRYIGDIVGELNRTQQLNHKELEKKRGFLIYVTRTYPAMVPFLKGIHQTLEMWRPNRDDDGWKLTRPAIQEVSIDHGEPPQFVDAAPRLAGDMAALQLLFSSVEPPRRKIRGTVVMEVFYGFGDASKTGFCTNFEIDGVIKYRYGHWCDASSEESSNYRELKNLVDGLEQQVKAGRVVGAEVFLFTDNSTAESVYFKGNSSSRKLFDLMLRLRKLEMDASLILHVVHVAGSRMIEEGGDGGSRGDLTQGVMSGRPILEYIPLHLSAPEREPGLVAWVRSWWDPEYGPLTILRPEGWFEEGQQDGNFVWVPPPAAADVVVEQLGEARHKRPHCLHITIVPRLMTSRWRKGLLKESDLEIVVPIGCGAWSKDQHEPLLMFISFPLCRHPPWSLRGTSYLEIFCRELRFLWDTLPDRAGPLLRQLLQRTRAFQSMPEDEDGFENVIEADADRFKCARNGDNLMVPFQCDVCHFRNIQKRNPDPLKYAKDALALSCIRRANLDSVWSREPSTVSRNASQARTMEDLGEALGFDSVAPPMGPFPLEDTFGMKIACVTLLKSLAPGKWENTVQYATARRMRSVFSNLYHASYHGESVSVMAYETQKMFTTPCPTYGYWYQRFNLGLHKRMGDVVRSDFAVTSEIINALLVTLNEEWEDAISLEARAKISEMAFVLVAGYCCGLRGEEIVKIDLAGLVKYLQVGKEDTEHPHVIVPLLGRIKGETGERYHMMVLARETQSGIKAGLWADRVANANKELKRERGPVFRNKKGMRAKIGDFESEFLERMIRLKISRPGLFEPGVDISESYSLFRSLRRGSTTQAVKMRVDQDIIELNNRWRKLDRARGMKPSLGMKHHYTEIKLVLAALWQYSWAM